MKTPRKRAPKDLQPAVSDLVAEGGNVLAEDDALVEGVAYVQVPEAKARTDEYSFDAEVPLPHGTVPRA